MTGGKGQVEDIRDEVRRGGPWMESINSQRKGGKTPLTRDEAVSILPLRGFFASRIYPGLFFDVNSWRTGVVVWINAVDLRNPVTKVNVKYMPASLTLLYCASMKGSAK